MIIVVELLCPIHDYYAWTLISDYSAVGDEVVTYEDVIKLSPDPERKRPIVLVGMSSTAVLSIP